MMSVMSLAMAVGLVAGIQQGPEKSVRVEVVPKRIYTPRGFDDNDTAEVIIEGEFESACLNFKEAKASVVNDDNIVFRVFADKYLGPCIQSTRSYWKAVQIDKLEEGHYSVWSNQKRDRPMGYLNIRHTDSPRRDDHDYAAVNSSVIFTDPSNQRSVLTLFGIHKNSCARFDREKFFIKKTSSDIVEILPILKKVDAENCKEGEFPFRENFTIPEEIGPGRYLFYIRIADGSSFYKIDFIQSGHGQ